MKKRDQKKLSLNKFTVARVTGIHLLYGGNEGDGEPTATVTKTLKTQKPPTKPTEVPEPPQAPGPTESPEM